MPVGGGPVVEITSSRDTASPEESRDGRLLYYGKYRVPGIWSVPVEGGEEKQVLGRPGTKNWAVSRKGIYFIDFTVPPQAPKPVQFYSFATADVKRIGAVEPTVSGTAFPGISISPDARWLLYSDITATTSDVMLLDGFR
jgi:hypothetical protein